jgi:hypothetical protein
VGELSLELQFEGTRLLRRCDAYDLLETALDEFAEHQDIHSKRDISNAREELRDLRESAYAELNEFKRRHGIGA